MTTILKQLREQKQYSQEQLSKDLGITRQTLINYENGTSIPTVENVKKLAKFFDVDYSCIIDNKEPAEPKYNILPAEEKVKEPDIRINIPQENINKFKQVLLYILNKVGAKPNVGQTVVYKLLYFIDFDYYELFEEQLMGLKYIKNTYGPTPIDFARLIKEMEADKQLEEARGKYFNKEQKKYLPLVKPDLSMLSGREIDHIDRELHRLSDMTASELSDFSHKDIPWIIAKDKEVLEYESVFYRTPETARREYVTEDD